MVYYNFYIFKEVTLISSCSVFNFSTNVGTNSHATIPSAPRVSFKIHQMVLKTKENIKDFETLMDSN